MKTLLKTHWNRFIRDEEGASGIEYALIAAMVAIALVTFVTPVRESVVAIFEDIRDALQSAASGGGN
ncbi:MAG TPA: Flp family type IVb pilin [Methylophilaceae bacterium]|jgi:pilus assembly protein Flp/PilA